MPSATFFNLSAEKRGKLIRAAWDEFGRAPFSEASINRLIQAADIPRGSFYQYFSGKEELFRFLLKDFLEGLILRLEETLVQYEGDPFKALPVYFERVLAGGWTENGTMRENLRKVLRQNPLLWVEALPTRAGREEIRRRVLRAVDPSSLDLRGEWDLEQTVGTLLGVTWKYLMAAALEGEAEQISRQYRNLLEILRRGMERRPGERPGNGDKE